MGRRGRISSCASCALLGLAVMGILAPTAVRADIADAMPAFRSHKVAGVPRCAANEELCPVSKGSNELHCVDLTDAKTCGGCVTDGDGLDCTSVPDVFMQQCTARGQCTGCRWKYGGMNASLEQPDFLSCSIILTQPVQASRHVPRRAPRLSFAKQLLKEKLFHTGPMPARKPQANYAADQAVAKHLHVPAHGKIAPLVPPKGAAAAAAAGLNEIPPPHVLQGQRDQLLFGNGQRAGQQPFANAMLQPHRGSTKEDSHIVKRDSFPSFELSEIPDPPEWLTAFTSSHLSNLPLTDRDDRILAWFQSLHDGIVKLAVKFHAMSPKEEKKKISNADRFRLKLPPVAPKGLVRPNKPAPLILPGMDYTEEEIEAMGLKDYIQTKIEALQEEEEETVTVHDHPSVFWGRLMKTAFRSTSKNVRSDVMDALWLLLDEVSQPQGEIKKPAAPQKAPAQAAKKQEKGGPNFFLPQDRKKAPAKLAGKPLEAAKVKPAQLRQQQPVFGQREVKEKAALDKARGAAVQPALQKRPGHLAADTPKKPVAKPANGAGLTNPLVPLARPDQSKPKALAPALERYVPAAVKPETRPGRGFVPENANGRLGPPPGQDAGVAKGYVPPIVNGQLGSPPQGKTNLLSGKKGTKPLQAPIPVKDETTGEDALDDVEADPYARERQRPVSKPKAADAKIGDKWELTLNADGTISKVKKPKSPEVPATLDAEDDTFDEASIEDSDSESPAGVPPEADSDTLSEDTPSDDETLMKLLALKQQEMVEIQKKIAQRKQRKQAAAKEKPIPAKKLLEDTSGLRFREGLLKRPNAVKAQKPLQPQLPKKLLTPLQPAVARQRPPAAGNEFEQHIRQAQQAKFLKLEDRVQPEKLLETLDTLENEKLAQGGEDMAGSGKKRPMMAGMAKARPHVKPDSNTGRGLKK